MKYLGQPQSGSIAAETYARNTYGQYARARVGRAGTGDAYFGTLAIAWSGTLTQAQRDGWEHYSTWVPSTDAFGRPVHLSGFQAFISANMNVSAAIGPFLQSTAPASPASFAVQDVAIANWITIPYVGLAVTFGNLPAGHTVIWHQTTIPLKAGQTFLPQRGATWKRCWGSGGPASTDNVQITGSSIGFAIGIRWREFRPDFVCGPWIHLRSPVR